MANSQRNGWAGVGVLSGHLVLPTSFFFDIFLWGIFSLRWLLVLMQLTDRIRAALAAVTSDMFSNAWTEIEYRCDFFNDAHGAIFGKV